ncbi:MAG: AMP-binding protein [Lachnospiraceae bacterium]|nr:AMP-binding protein [Lachnospiraceae bacterium]
MNICFSTKNQTGTFDELCAMANSLGYNGIEIHDLYAENLLNPVSPFTPEMAAITKRALSNRGLEIACINSNINIAHTDADNRNFDDFVKVIETARNLSAQYVKVTAVGGTEDNVYEFLDRAVPVIHEYEVELLIETCGIYSDTKKLREVLNNYATDYLGADWNMHDTFFCADEEPDTTITNLGAYVKLAHILDQNQHGEIEFIGDGILPIKDMVNAIRSVNYDGFVGIEWDPEYIEGVDFETVFSHFYYFMDEQARTSKKEKHYYYNNAHTGKFLWKKETLIDKTFPELLDTMANEFPDQPMFKYTTLDYERTYAQFREDVDNFARSLIAMGVKKGSKVSIWATNVPAWYLTFWAATKIGAVLVTVNTAYKIHEAEYLFRQSDTHTLVMIQGFKDSDYEGIVKELCPELEDRKPGKHLHCKRLPFLRNVITVGFKMKGAYTWDEAMKLGESVPVQEVYRMQSNVDKDDVANMQYTSGTTGFPKGVMLTHYNIVNNGKNIGDRMDLSTADRMMIQVPMFHCFGMVLAMTASVTHGVTMCPVPYFSPKASLACIHQEKITAFHGVPTMFIAMLEHKDFPKTDFSHMRTGIMAGSPCPVAVMQDVVNKMHMTEITIVYGQTESSPGCTMSCTTDTIEQRVNTVGRNLPEIECKIVDPETGEDCPPNTNGEFVARGYNIMKGYYKMPKATAAAIDKEGWLHTGDLALMTEDGFYKITGRLKDMIIRGGENIYPKEIEEFIYTHDKVQDVQVIGVPDEAMGEEIMACIVLKKGETMTEAEMKEYVMSHMAKHKVPKYIDFVEGFPMNAAGKILKYKMREDAIEKLGLQKASKIVTA